MFHYGYFVILPNGLLVPAGNDWGPTIDTYKVGDSLGVKNAKEGIVVGVFKGVAAKQSGIDVMPEGLVDRLRNYNEFQGARYEVAIAAAFVKCDFEIDWAEDRAAKHPEFIARNPHTREEVEVETKSRRQTGVLHQPGTLPSPEQLRVDVDRLYREALEQDPGKIPFAIFVDVNLPPSATSGAVAQWQREVVERWKDEEQRPALLGFTNFGWHYLEDKLAATPEFLLSVPLTSERPLKSMETLPCLTEVLNHYGVPPNEY